MANTRAKLPTHPDDVRMSFGEHLEELRWRLVKALLGVAVATAICIYFGSQILGFLIQPLRLAMIEQGYRPELLNLSPTETFMEYFSTCLIFGLGISAPFALYQLWQFIAAGLYPHERRYVSMFAPASMILFFTGVIFLIKLVLPATLSFLIWTAGWVPTPSFADQPLYPTSQAASAPASHVPILDAPPVNAAEGSFWVSRSDGSLNVKIGGKIVRYPGTEAEADKLVKPMYSLSEYLSFVNGMCLAFGLGFQIPIVVILLVLVRLVSAAQLSKFRKIIIVIIISAGAILTPSGDISSQLLLAVPMYVLFESGLWIAHRIERNRPQPK